MKHSLSLNMGIGNQKFVLRLIVMLILLCNEDFLILDAEEHIAKLHTNALGTTLNESCKLL